VNYHPTSRVASCFITVSAAEWVAEKAVAIVTGALALGVTAHLGIIPPILGSLSVTTLLTQKSEELFGGKFIVEVDPERASQLLLEHIKMVRMALEICIETKELKIQSGITLVSPIKS
jgi:hydroxylamine reductase (hybrid-cluster protein)